MLVKRVLALEGDVVKTLPPYPDQEIVVPEGYVWVEGLIPSHKLLFEEGLSLIQKMLQAMNLSSAMTATVLDRYSIKFFHSVLLTNIIYFFLARFLEHFLIQDWL